MAWQFKSVNNKKKIHHMPDDGADEAVDDDHKGLPPRRKGEGLHTYSVQDQDAGP